MATHTVPCTSHEFPQLSWYAAFASGGSDVEQVAEESGHRPVWGLRAGADPVTVPLPGRKTDAKQRAATASVRTAEPGAVGLNEEPARLNLLAVALPRGVAWEQFADAARDAYERHFGTRYLKVFYTRKFYETVLWKLYGAIPPRPLDSVKLAGGGERELLADAQRFLGAEAEYVRLGRPYKRVYCLHGPPGTGKTSVVTAIASELKRPLAIFNTDALRDDTFLELLSERPDGAVLLFEDVDALFRGRAAGTGTGTGTGTGGMTFSTLLNALDGVLHPRGAIVFLTTNHLDRMDAALQRPGRVDRLVHVPALSAQQAAELWRTFYPSAPALPTATLAALVKRGVSPATLSQELFLRRDEGAAAAAKAVVALAAAPPK